MDHALALVPADIPKEMERRMVFRLLGYWREVRGDREFASLNDIVPEAIEEMWPYCFVLDREKGEADPIFHYMGPKLIEYCGLDLTDKPASTAPEGTLIGRSVAYFKEVIEKAVPITTGGNFIDQHGQKIVFRSVVMPLGDGQGQISHLLGAANCRVVTET